jgi:hypothetical protein
MNANTPSITVSTAMTVLVAGAGEQVDTQLSYRATDPYAVVIAFADENVEWVVGRDLVADGLCRSAGIGDVRIGPDPTDETGTLIELSSPGGTASLRVDSDVLADFLRQTTELVPVGTESHCLDLDLMIAQLVDSKVS